MNEENYKFLRKIVKLSNPDSWKIAKNEWIFEYHIIAKKNKNLLLWSFSNQKYLCVEKH